MAKKILFSVTNGYALEADDMTKEEIADLIECIRDNDYEGNFTYSKGTFNIINASKQVHFEGLAWVEED